MPDVGDEPVVRLSDAEREHTIAVLRQHTGEGRLTLDEFAERAGLAYGAASMADLEPLLADLPVLAPLPPRVTPDVTPGAKVKRKWIVAIMSGARRRGQWRVDDHIAAIAIMGGVDLDLRGALIESPVVDITAWAVMGGIEIIVPEGIAVEVDGFVLMGGLENRVKSTVPAGGPVIRVHGYGMWGGVTVRTRPPRSREALEEAGGDYQNINLNFNQNQNRNQNHRHEHRDHRRDGRRSMVPPPIPMPNPPGEWLPQVPLPAPFGRHDHRGESLVEQVAADDVLPEPTTVSPTGTVTILFTDISHSTELAERIGDQRWVGVLSAHNALVREQISRHGGTEVKHHGDGFMVVFPSARRALLCAIAIQRAMAGYRQGHPDTPVDLRIGLHTGEVIEDGGDYFGRNVILAARIANEAAGGEILASALVKELADSGGDLGFDDGRDVELKGMSRPWRVHTVDW
jgi:class 3 adenylate cyclase